MRLCSVLNLGHCLDALGAEYLAREHALFHNAHALKIGLELVPRGAQRVAAAVTEHGAFATIFADSHDPTSKGVIILQNNAHATIPPGTLQGSRSSVVSLRFILLETEKVLG